MNKTFRIPKAIYESMPALYVIAGVSAMSLVDSYVSFASGLLMGIAGVAILFMRRNYRAQRQLINQH